MDYVIDGDSKINNIWGRYFNTLLKMINNTLCMEDENIWLDWLQFVSWYLFHIHHIRNDNICGYGWTPYAIIKFVNLCQVCYIGNVNICGTEQTLYDFKILAITSVSLIDDFNSPF